MKKRTTNPALIKRFFAKKAEIGDCSKDLIVEPDYALVFTRKLPYFKEARHRMVAWMPSDGARFYVYTKNGFGLDIEKLVKAHAPESSVVVTTGHHIYRALSIMNRLANVNDDDQTAQMLCERLNEHMPFVEEKDFWELVDKNPDLFKSLWQGANKSLPSLPSKLSVELVTRRLQND